MNSRPDLQQCIDRMNKLFFATMTGDENRHTPVADKVFATIAPHDGNMVGYAEQMCAALDNVLFAMMMSAEVDKAGKQGWWENIRKGQVKIRECGRNYTLSILSEALETVKNHAKALSAEYDDIAAANAGLKSKLDQMTVEHLQIVKEYEEFKAQVSAELNKITGASYKPGMY